MEHVEGRALKLLLWAALPADSAARLAKDTGIPSLYLNVRRNDTPSAQII